VRALHDPVWTADGYVSDRWRPVSPVTGRLDAFQWQTPLASLPSDKGATIESSPFEEAMLAAPAPRREQLGEPPREITAEIAPEPATQDNSPPESEKAESKNESKIELTRESKIIEAAGSETKPAEPVPVASPDLSAPESSPPQAAPPPSEPPAPAAPAPLFRSRSDLGRLSLDKTSPGKPAGAPIPAVIPILRAPDDPGIDDEAPVDEFTEKIGTPRAQAGGWRGFWSRFGG
jgi:HemY protein